VTWSAAAGRVTRVALRLLDGLIGVIVAGLLAVVASQFVDRNLVDLWVHSPEEYLKVGIVWLCFLGLVRAFASDEILRISFLYDALPRTTRRALDLLVCLLLIAVLVVLCRSTWTFVRVAQFQTILGTDMSLAVPAAALLIGFGLVLVVIVARLGQALRGHELHRPGSGHP
jgi:TRAP-type C4-dicarboxylate transport system permease small subunit